VSLLPVLSLHWIKSIKVFPSQIGHLVYVFIWFVSRGTFSLSAEVYE
jgi:hypothetical protein